MADDDIRAQASTKGKSTVTVHAFASPRGGSVNSYWLETKAGLILIDAQRQVSQAHKLLAQMAETKKPLLGILITHSHPDHVGGLKAIHEAYPQAPILYSQATLDLIRSDKGGFFKLSKQAFGDDIDIDVPAPTRILSARESFAIGGLEFVAEEIGPGEAGAMTVFYLPQQRSLFAADLIAHRMTPFLMEGRSTAWLKQLREVQAKYRAARLIYPGHGASGAASTLLKDQIEYLSAFRTLVSQQQRDGGVSAEAKQKIVTSLAARYHDYDAVAEIPGLIELNIDAIARELAAKQ